MKLKLVWTLPLLAATSLCALRAPGDKLSFHPTAGSTLTRSYESRQEISLDEVEMTMNGQPFPTGAGEEMTMVQTQSLEIGDEFAKIEGGKSLQLVRSFTKISSEGEFTMNNPMMGGEQNNTVTAKTELEGKTVVFDWDEAASEFKKSFKPEGPDEKLLEGLVEDIDFKAFLPEKAEVAEEDSWSVDVAAMKTVLLPGGNLSLKPEKDGEPGGEMNMFGDNPADAFGDLEGEVKATYKGARDVEGTSCGVIALEFKVKSAQDMSDKVAEAMEKQNTQGVEIRVDHMDVVLSLEGEGELLWDLKAGHVHSFSMSAKVKNQIDMAMQIGMGEKNMEMERKMDMSGSYELKLGVTRN